MDGVKKVIDWTEFKRVVLSQAIECYSCVNDSCGLEPNDDLVEVCAIWGSLEPATDCNRLALQRRVADLKAETCVDCEWSEEGLPERSYECGQCVRNPNGDDNFKPKKGAE